MAEDVVVDCATLPAHVAEDVVDCAVCLAPVNGDGSTTRCGHKFHTTCLLRSYSVNASCPLCREDLVPLELQNETRLSRLEETRRTSRENASYLSSLHQAELEDEELGAAHAKWAELEQAYTEADSAFASHFQHMVERIKRSRTFRALERERSTKRRHVAAAKLVFQRELRRSVGELPPTFLEEFLRDREILNA